MKQLSPCEGTIASWARWAQLPLKSPAYMSDFTRCLISHVHCPVDMYIDGSAIDVILQTPSLGSRYSLKWMSRIRNVDTPKRAIHELIEWLGFCYWSHPNKFHLINDVRFAFFTSFHQKAAPDSWRSWHSLSVIFLWPFHSLFEEEGTCLSNNKRNTLMAFRSEKCNWLRRQREDLILIMLMRDHWELCIS